MPPSIPATPAAPCAGVFPVLPTPFHADGSPDAVSLRRLVRYLLAAGVDGVTYPGVASEVGQLSPAERHGLLAAVVDEVAGRVPVIAGASAGTVDAACSLAASAAQAGATLLMVAAPAGPATPEAQADWFRAVAAAAGGTPLMLQNLPAPAGAGLDPAVLLQVLQAVPQIHYVKEEALPSGQRLTALLRGAAGTSLRAVFGGAGGRYITDELRRGAGGTMPAIELAEVHVALWAAHQRGDAAAVRGLFTRMLPILNMQAVFRWALTKDVLLRRGLIGCALQRIDGPLLDAGDRAELTDFLADIQDLLLPASRLAEL